MLEPKDWGWKENGTTLSPILSDDVVAPEKLLKYIRCKCKLSAKNPCGGNACVVLFVLVLLFVSRLLLFVIVLYLILIGLFRSMV